MICRSMYGLLQLLPQSDAFKTLHARLQSAPTMPLLHLNNLSTSQSAASQPAASEATTSAPVASVRRKWQRMTSTSSSPSLAVELSGQSTSTVADAADIPWAELLKLFCERQVITTSRTKT